MVEVEVGVVVGLGVVVGVGVDVEVEVGVVVVVVVGVGVDVEVVVEVEVVVVVVVVWGRAMNVVVDDQHRYAAIGELYPSVTTILRDTGPRRYGLERWKLLHGELADDIGEIAAERGKRLHREIAHYRSTGAEPITRTPFWISIFPFVRTLRSIFPTFESEVPMVHLVDGYGGTPDDISIAHDGAVVVHDWKSGLKPKTRAQLEECFAQIGGYADLIAYNRGVRPQRAAVVVAIPDRGPQVVPVNLGRWVGEWRRRLELYKGGFS